MPRSTLLILIVLFVGACTPPDDTAPFGPDGPKYVVSGLVYDSLSREVGGQWALGGITVSVNGITAITDAGGRFTAHDVACCSGSVIVESRDFEPYQTTIDIDRDRTIDIRLRRQAPLVTRFLPSGDSTRFVVVDLQNRKSVERWQSTRAYLENATTDWTQQGDQWVWTPVEDETWLVSMSG